MIRSTRTGRYIKQPKKPVKVSLKDRICTAVVALSVVVGTGYVIGHSLPVSAQTEKVATFHSPVPEQIIVTPSVTPTASPTLTVTPVREMQVTELSGGVSDWDYFVERAEYLSMLEGYPVKVLLAQAALESGYGRSHFAKTRYNYFGLCAYTSDPNQACSFETVDDGILFYINLIKTTPRYSKAWAARDNAEQMVREIKNAGYATDEAYVSKVANIMSGF